jgi:molybdopterin/thiamine biosynthesis adenylyltransferase
MKETMTQETYFKRQIELWGAQAQNRLSQKNIAIIGSGGLGSSLAMALGTSGIGRVDMVDFDTVSLHNIHRQIAFTLEDEGKNKAKCVSQLMQRKNPFLHTTPFEMDFEAFSQMENHHDLLIDATDNLPTREAIDTYAKQKQTPWIYGSVEAFNGQVCFIEQSNFKVMTISNHTPGGIAAPMVMHIASLQANFAIRYLVGLPIDKDKLYYLYINEMGELMTQRFGMPKML